MTMSNSHIATLAEGVFEDYEDASTEFCLALTADICECDIDDVVAAMAEQEG